MDTWARLDALKPPWGLGLVGSLSLPLAAGLWVERQELRAKPGAPDWKGGGALCTLLCGTRVWAMDLLLIR